MRQRGAQHEISRLDIAGTTRIVYSVSCEEKDPCATAYRLIREFGLRVIKRPFFGYLWDLSRPDSGNSIRV